MPHHHRPQLRGPAAARRALAVGLGLSIAALALGAPSADATPATRAATPASVDLTPWAVPAGDQGRLGSSASWTVGYTIAGWWARREAKAGAPFAPMYLYSQLTGGRAGVAAGASLTANLSLAQSSGIDPRADYPQGDLDAVTAPTAAQRANAANFRLAGWTSLYWTPVQAVSISRPTIEQALAAGQPVALGIKVYSNLLAIGAGNARYSTPSGAFAGVHALAVLGYDDFGVRVESSWGRSWGADGFAWLSWSYVANHSVEAHAVSGLRAPAAGAAPALTSMSPTSGSWSGGDTVVLEGSDLSGARVWFGALPSPAVTVAADGRSLTAVVPTAGTTGPVDVAVSTLVGGRSGALAYTYVAGTPAIATVNPASAPITGGTVVTLTGSNLAPMVGKPYTVAFNGVPSPRVTPAADGHSLTAVVPAGAVGSARIVVTNAGGAGAPATFLYTWPARPALTLTAPGATVAPGNVTLSGAVKNAQGTGYRAIPVTVQARPLGSAEPFAPLGTAVTATNGTFALTRRLTTSMEVLFTVPGDLASPVLGVRVVPPPSLVGSSASAGPRTGGQTVTLSGSNLQGATVTIGGAPGRNVVVNAAGTSLTFVTPARATGATVLFVTTPSGVSRTLAYRYTA